MTATEELRRMLDYRGVEWKATKGAMDTIWTHWDMFTGHRVHAMDNEDGTVRICGEYDVTPEQAIAATLGSCNCTNGERTNGTCHMRLAYEEEDADGFIWPDHYECSACGANVNGIMPSYDTEVPPRFCPNCGRKVVGDG